MTVKSATDPKLAELLVFTKHTLLTSFQNTMTVFARTKDHTLAPSIGIVRITSAIIHLAIPALMYQVMYNGLGSEFLSKYTTVEPLSAERKQLYLFLDIFYAVRWAIGMLTMLGEVTFSSAMLVAAFHILVHELPYIVFSMGFYGAPIDLTVRDYVAAALMVIAGVLQHGSELQRWAYKRDPKNRGKLHSGGLFSLARGFNHTGHILRDVASLMFAPNPVLLIYLVLEYDLLFQIIPATIAHMKIKYGEQYTKYERQTPALFIPGIW
jgi:protein-S-isoprenylcysteine O-methyltransferase Ste14